MSEQNSTKSHSSNPETLVVERSANAVTRQVSALDQMITASLEQSSANKDRQGLADLIQSMQVSAKKNVRTANKSLETVDDYPVVNRALKRDRAPLRADVSADILSSFIQATNRSLEQENSDTGQTKSITDVKNVAPFAKKQAGDFIVKTALDREIPFADSADIALFAADIPLPAKLIHNASANDGGALLSRSYASPYSRSPLVPRKLASGKAFGGLAERAFQKRERRCMTTALFFEARSEPEAGQIAVGQVIMNRVRSPDYPDTICGVIYQGSHRRTGCQFSFTCDGKADKPNNATQWERSKRLANRVLEGKVWLKSIGDATHYHATYVKPRWRRKMARIIKIGRHIFYKSPKVSVTDTYQRYVTGERS
jgi:hypothetical protein